VQASRKQDRRLAAALLAAALAHTPEGEEVLRGARTRMARKPSALARELLRNFPKGRRRRAGRRRRGKGGGDAGQQQGGNADSVEQATVDDDETIEPGDGDETPQDKPKPKRSRSRRRKRAVNADPGEDGGAADDEPAAA
jgi:hypothetical protein